MITKDLEFMKNPMEWPHMVLPIKRGMESAILIGNGPEIFLVNMWSLPQDNIESIKFNSFEEIIEAGWIVD